MRKLLVVVDMQNDFISGSLGSEEAKQIVPFVVDRINEGKNAGWDIMFTRDTHYENYLETQEGKKLPVPHCIKGTKGWEIAAELQEAYPDFENVTVNKPTFGSTELLEILKNRPEYDEIELLGLCTDICVISNAMLMKANFLNAEVFVNSKCSAGVTPASHNNALEAMKMCQITII